jgi:hypothetical protein
MPDIPEKLMARCGGSWQKKNLRTRDLLGMGLFIVLAIATWTRGHAALFKDAITFHASPDVFSLAVSDVNGDGRQDVIATSYDSLWASVLLQGPFGGLQPAINTQLWDLGTYEAAAADFNGDGRADLATPSSSHNTLSIYTGNADGTLTYLGQKTAIDQAPSAIAVGDFDSDGHVDIAVANWSPEGRFAIHLGAGDATFGPRTDFPTGPGATDIASSDVNGDGKLDLVVTFNGYSLPGSDSVAIHLGNGDGTFSTRHSYLASSRPYYVAIDDLTNDGKPDLAVACWDGSISVLVNTGGGTFAPPMNYAVSPSPMWAAIGDFDGNGWKDIAVTDADDLIHPQTVAVLMNRGDATFDPPSYEPVGVAPTGIVSEDLTGDGRADVVITSRRLDSVYFLESCAPCTPTSVEAILLEVTSDESGVHIRWSVSEPEGSTATVERRTDTEAWQTRLGSTPIDGSIFSFHDADVAAGERYAYRLVIHSSDGTIATPEMWVEVSGTPMPRSLVLDRPFPNPTGGAIRLRLGLPRDGPAELSVFDVSGRLVARMSTDRQSAGWHDLTWDARDREGRPVASGTYFLRLTAGETVSRRFVVLR